MVAFLHPHDTGTLGMIGPIQLHNSSYSTQRGFSSKKGVISREGEPAGTGRGSPGALVVASGTNL
jgi:hypothetical protein